MGGGCLTNSCLFVSPEKKTHENKKISKVFFLSFLTFIACIRFRCSDEACIGYIGIRDICNFTFRDMGY